MSEVAIIINSASYDKVSYALNIASVSAALGKKLTFYLLMERLKD